MNQQRIRHYVDDALAKSEVVIYVILGGLLFVTALLALISAGEALWESTRLWTIAAQTLQVLDDFLVVLMLVEIFHTVRISIRSHVLVTEPFLIVGLIASVRRILVITLEAAALTKSGAGETESRMFRESMIELGLLGGLVLVFVFSIGYLRRFTQSSLNGEDPFELSRSSPADS